LKYFFYLSSRLLLNPQEANWSEEPEISYCDALA